MKKILFLFTVFSLLSICAFSNEKMEVLRVFDGDTVLVQIDGNVFAIRLSGIDCFEKTPSNRAKRQAKKYKTSLNNIVNGGNLATEYLEKELKGKEYSFEFRGIDKYSRALGVLYANGENINQKMLKTPYCKPYIYNPAKN